MTSEVTTPATDTEPGVRTYTAVAKFGTEEIGFESFDDEKTEEIDPAIADYEFDSFEWSADCTSAKAVLKNKTDPTLLMKVDAIVTSESHAATCTANAYTVYTATYDEHTESKTVTQENSMLDHHFTIVMSDASGHWYKCENCSALSEKEEHSGGTATCMAKPTCAVCGVEYGKKLRHEFTNYVYDNNATCTKNGTETAVCDHGCGRTDTRTKLWTATGHAWGEWVETVPATCSSEGTRTHTCQNDASHVETEVIPKLAHVDENGDTLCDVCGGPTDAHKHDDVDGDGKCDSCGQDTDAHSHTDADHDNICDVCGNKVDTGFRCSFCNQNDAMQASHKNVAIKMIYRIIHFIIHAVQGIRFSV